MNTIEQKQLIEKMQMLRDIKPNREWAVLLKSQIINPKTQPNLEIITRKIGILDFIGNWKLGFGISKRLAYSFATLLLIIAGLAGFAGYTTPDEQTASLIMPTTVNQNVVAINSRIRDLTKALEVTPKQDPQTIKGIVESLKTLADVQGTNFSENQDVKDLYRILVLSQISTLENSTITEEQEITLLEIEQLADNGKYTEALEKILLIN